MDDVQGHGEDGCPEEHDEVTREGKDQFDQVSLYRTAEKRGLRS